MGGGSAWALEVEVVSHRGSDSFRRNFTRINHMRYYMTKLGVEVETDAHLMNYLAVALELSCGGFLMYAGLVTAYRTIEAWSKSAAAVETAQKAALGPPGWAMIAFAAGIAASVGVGFEAGAWAGRGFKGPENVTVRSNWGNPGGRARVVSTLRSVGPEGEQ